MEYKRNILTIEDIVTGEVYFVSDELKKLIQDNIESLLEGKPIINLMFVGRFKTLKLDHKMNFVLEEQGGEING